MLKKYLITFYLAVLGGACIGIGGTVFLSVDNKIAGAFLFSVGLCAIVTGGLNLYTGKIGYIISNPPSYIAQLAVIWLGNLCGAGAVGLLIRATRSSVTSSAMCAVKTGDSALSVFILSVFCGMLMYIAVNGYKTISDPFGRYVVVILGVMTFILSGFEHCVANMFYFTLAGAWNLHTFAWLLIMTAGNSAGSVIMALGTKAAAKN